MDFNPDSAVTVWVNRKMVGGAYGVTEEQWERVTPDKKAAMSVAEAYVLKELGWGKAVPVAAIEDEQGSFLVKVVGKCDMNHREMAVLVEFDGRKWEVTNETEVSDFELNAAEIKRCNYCCKKVEVREITLGVCRECASHGIES